MGATVMRDYTRPLDLKNGRVEMAHGAGGRAMAHLIEELFARRLGNEWLAQGDDGAVLPAPGEGRLVMATDSHVVSPLFFPGGDIGCLSVHGTINDVAVMGAKPLWLSAAFILEEGFPLSDLARIVDSMALAARQAGVPVVTGDTKVVERGKGDGVFITTTGVGLLPVGRELSGRRAQPGDAILVSGTLGDHGMAIMAGRDNLGFESPIVSDTAALHGLIDALLECGADIPCAARPDARRPGDDAQRDRPAVGRRHDDSGKGATDQSAGRRSLRISRAGSALCCQRRQTGGDLRRK